MIKEIAIDPNLFSRDPNFLISVIDELGFHKGRLLSLFPRKWKKKALEYIQKLPDGRRKSKIIDKILDKEGLISKKSGLDYNPNMSWLENINNVQANKAFDAVIGLCNKNYELVVCDDDYVTFEEPPLFTKLQLSVERKALPISNAVKKLISHSKQIRFIDPYFDVLDVDKRWLNVLGKCLAHIKNDFTEIEIHFSYSKVLGYGNDWENYYSRFSGWLKDLIPEGIIVSFFAWNTQKNGEKFHDRFILTDKGGVNSSVGLDEGRSGETTLLSLCDRNTRTEIWKRYDRNSKTFELMGHVAFDHECNIVL